MRSVRKKLKQMPLHDLSRLPVSTHTSMHINRDQVSTCKECVCVYKS